MLDHYEIVHQHAAKDHSHFSVNKLSNQFQQFLRAIIYYSLWSIWEAKQRPWFLLKHSLLSTQLFPLPNKETS